MNSRKHWPSMFMKSKSSRSLGASSRNSGMEGESPQPKEKLRWIPKPEQIRILEAMFNSGIVNPPREEIKIIRARLAQFGEVEDTNVFYWFQNRKSKIKRRQRQLQAAQRYSSSSETGTPSSSLSMSTTSTSVQSKPTTDLSNSPPANAMRNNIEDQYYSSAVLNSSFPGQQYNWQALYDEMSNIYNDLGNMQSIGGMSNYNDLGNMQSIGEVRVEGSEILLNEGKENVQDLIVNSNSSITVFINDRPIVVPMGPINFGAFFGDQLLFHSSGGSVLPNEWGLIDDGLENGANYFLI